MALVVIAGVGAVGISEVSAAQWKPKNLTGRNYVTALPPITDPKAPRWRTTFYRGPNKPFSSFDVKGWRALIGAAGSLHEYAVLKVKVPATCRSLVTTIQLSPWILYLDGSGGYWPHDPIHGNLVIRVTNASGKLVTRHVVSWRARKHAGQIVLGPRVVTGKRLTFTAFLGPGEQQLERIVGLSFGGSCRW